MLLPRIPVRKVPLVPKFRVVYAIGDPVGAGQRLCGHEITGSVVGTGFEQNGEFGQGTVEVALLRVFHGQTVAREGIVGILREDVVQSGNAVHKTVLGSEFSVEMRLLQTAPLLPDLF